jgi:hypothetical protein
LGSAIGSEGGGCEGTEAGEEGCGTHVEVLKKGGGFEVQRRCVLKCV